MAEAKVSHPKETKKSDQQQEEKPSRHDVERLAVDLSAVLQNPACPGTLFEGITDTLVEIQNEVNTLTPDFLRGLFRSPRKGGAA